MSNVSLDANDSSVTENQPQDNNRRRFLTVATSVVGGVGAVSYTHLTLPTNREV